MALVFITLACSIIVQPVRAQDGSEGFLEARDLERSMQYGEGETAFEIGHLYRAYEIWQKLAKQGYAPAEYRIGGFYDRGDGSHVWDVDGNEFIDYVLARGPLLLGHSPRPVIEAAQRQMDRGLMYAGQHPLEIEAAEAFCELVPCAEMVRFASS